MTSSWFAPKHHHTDEELINLAKTGDLGVYGRYIVNELQARSSPFLEPNAEIFLGQVETHVPIQVALKNQSEFRDLPKVLAYEDVPIVIEARNKLGLSSKSLFTNMAQQAEVLRARPSLDKQLLDLASDEDWTFSLNLDQLKEPSSGKDVTLIGITKVKDEGPLLLELLDHLLTFCDHVVVSDASDPPAASMIPGHVASRVTIIPQLQPYDEAKTFESLVNRALSLKATHILHMDADERLSEQISPEQLRSTAATLGTGEALAVPWIQLLNDDGPKRILFEQFSEFSFGRLRPHYRDLVIAAPTVVSYPEMPLHCPWTPEGVPIRRVFANIPLLHLEGLNHRHWIQKYNSYFHWDFSLSRDMVLAIRRYLPLFFRNTRLSASDRTRHLEPWSGILPMVYAEELARRAESHRERRTEDQQAASVFDLFAFELTAASD